MNATEKMKQTMEQMLANSGHTATVKILPRGYAVETFLANGPKMTLTFSDELTPGDVVYQSKNILDKIKGKAS